MLWLLIWIMYGLVVGGLAKLIYIGEDPKGILSTVTIGIAGSYVGGLINYLLGQAEAVSYSGALMGIIGAVVCCWIYDKFHFHRIMEMKQAQIASLKMRMSQYNLNKDED